MSTNQLDGAFLGFLLAFFLCLGGGWLYVNHRLAGGAIFCAGVALDIGCAVGLLLGLDPLSLLGL